MKPKRGNLFLLSAASSGGKDTIKKGAMAQRPQSFVLQKTCTTRQPRNDPGDRDKYYFMTVEEFLRRKAEGYFLETAQVHGHWYGTPLQETVEKLEAGYDVLIDIDVQGAQQVRECEHAVIVEALVDCFVYVSDPAALRQRLVDRDGESETTDLRFANAQGEQEQAPHFKHVIYNDTTPEAAIDAFLNIVDERKLAA